MKLLRGKRALVTGAASGIGRAIALQLAREGMDLFLVDIQADKLAAIVTEVQTHGVRAIGRVCNVTDHQQIRQTVAELLQAWGALELLVNNAGITYRGSTHAMTTQQWDDIIAVNLLAPIRFIDALLPTFRRQNESHILNISSIFGLIPLRRIAAYQTTKYALVGLGQSLSLEYDSYGLGVTTLCPGFVTTDLFDTAQRTGMLHAAPMLWSWWSVTPEYVALQAVKSIKKNRGLVVIPLLSKIFWLLLRLFPSFIDRLVKIKRRSTRRHHGPHVTE